MNVKELSRALIFGIGAGLLAYYFFPAKRSMPSGQDATSFTVQECVPVSRPLNREVDFIDTKRTQPPLETEVQTDWGELVFTSDGATLDRIGFSRTVDGQQQMHYTIFPAGPQEREGRCFLLAFNEKTPYFYQYLGQRDLGDALAVIYEAQTDIASVRKTYEIDKKTHKVDLVLEVVPRLGSVLEPRIFVPAPVVPEADVSVTGARALFGGGSPVDLTSVVLFDRNGTYEKISGSSLEENRGWVTPQIFGADGKYFIHGMVRDEGHFVGRAYTARSPRDTLLCIFEGPRIQEPMSWRVSFYLGPKEERALAAVDPRLERTIGHYWILAPLSKVMLGFLNWLYDYVHNYGIAIILLTLLLKLFMLPFSIRAERSMKDRAELQKKLDYLQQRYKHDKERLAQERAEFMRKHGIPGAGGCLPMLLQLPIFIALNSVLQVAYELHRAPFLWIPDLSAKDPYYILPMLVVVSMIAQAATVDAKQRMSMIATACIFGAFSANFPAGLTLFIFASTMLSVVQTRVMKLLRIVR